MKELLDGMLPRIFPNLQFLCIAYDGKQDLDHSIRPQLRDWRTPGDCFVIVRDNDGGDCFALKQRIRQLCQGTGHDDALVRIVCQELEAWYLGQPDALADAFGDAGLRNIRNRPRFRDPDSRPKPSKDISSLYPAFQKVDGARRMAAHLTREGNHSHSFNVFMEGIAGLFPEPAGNS
jgi:hypothetical protein